MPKTNCLGCGILITYAKRDYPPEYCPNCSFMASNRLQGKAVEVKPYVFNELPKSVIDFKTEQFQHVKAKSEQPVEEIIEEDKISSGVTSTEWRPKRRKVGN